MDLKKPTFRRYGQWWRAPEDERFWAYYMCLRTIYQMPAAEALAYAKASHREFIQKPIETLRNAMGLPYPGCHMPEKCRHTGRCHADPVCFN